MSVNESDNGVLNNFSELNYRQRDYDNRLQSACSGLGETLEGLSKFEGTRKVINLSFLLAEEMSLPDDSLASVLLAEFLVAGELGDPNFKLLHPDATEVTASFIFGDIRRFAELIHEDPHTRRSTILDLKVMRQVVELESEKYGRRDSQGSSVFPKCIDQALEILERIE